MRQACGALLGCVRFRAIRFGAEYRVTRAAGAWERLPRPQAIRGNELQHYFVVQTHSNVEALAEASLSAEPRNFDVYFPKVLARLSHARKVTLAPRPFLPRYGFVRDDGRSVSLIKTARGVCTVIRLGSDPARVRHSVIQDIIDREVEIEVVLNGKRAKRRFVQIDPGSVPATSYKYDEQVRVVDDAGNTLTTALFKQMRGETRAELFFGVLGKLNVPIVNLRKVA